MPRRAAFIAIAVEQQAAIDARKYQPGFGADAFPPIGAGMSVCKLSPLGPLGLARTLKSLGQPSAAMRVA